MLSIDKLEEKVAFTLCGLSTDTPLPSHFVPTPLCTSYGGDTERWVLVPRHQHVIAIVKHQCLSHSCAFQLGEMTATLQRIIPLDLEEDWRNAEIELASVGIDILLKYMPRMLAGRGS